VSIEALAHEREIIALTVRYAWALDNRRFEDLALVFSEDGVADYGSNVGTHRGPGAIGEACARSLSRFDRTQHIVSNHQVTIDGQTAHGRCYFQAQHVVKEADGDHNYTIAGNYLDQYRHTEDGWRIAHRTLRTTWRDGDLGSGPQPASDTSFVIAGWIQVDPAGVDDLLVAAVEMMRATHEEPGNLEYVFSADPAVPGRIRVFERWRSEADLRGHFDAPHMVTFQKALAQAGVTDRDLSRFTVSAVGPVFG
jgi:quinol monooxygenase YgiN/3-phenylpropionate/cinnamic acid dioxygenase small subunit